MPTHTYIERRGQLEDYFDRTAVEAWKRLTSDAPVGRIRATVRAGRDQMRVADEMLGHLLVDRVGVAAGRSRQAAGKSRRASSPVNNFFSISNRSTM